MNIMSLHHHKIIKTFFLIILVIIITNIANTKEILNVKIRSIKGEEVETKNFVSREGSVLIVFFSICCNPSLNALDDINDEADKWIEEYDLKIILVSVDDIRNSKKIAPLLSSKGIYFDTYLDENAEFKRAMGVSGKPHYILFDSTGNTIYERTGYMPNIMEDVENAIK